MAGEFVKFAVCVRLVLNGLIDKAVAKQVKLEPGRWNLRRWDPGVEHAPSIFKKAYILCIKVLTLKFRSMIIKE